MQTTGIYWTGPLKYDHHIVALTVEMGKHCGCSNTHHDSVSLFHFPWDPLLQLQWTRQIQWTRDGCKGPSDYSVVFSEHFTSDCFEKDSAMAAKFGVEKRKCLKPNAVPTVFLRVSSRRTPNSSSRQMPTFVQAVSELVEKYQSQWKRKEWHTRRGRDLGYRF